MWCIPLRAVLFFLSVVVWTLWMKCVQFAKPHFVIVLSHGRYEEGEIHIGIPEEIETKRGQ